MLDFFDFFDFFRFRRCGFGHPATILSRWHGGVAVGGRAVAHLAHKTHTSTSPCSWAHPSLKVSTAENIHRRCLAVAGAHPSGTEARESAVLCEMPMHGCQSARLDGKVSRPRV